MSKHLVRVATEKNDLLEDSNHKCRSWLKVGGHLPNINNIIIINRTNNNNYNRKTMMSINTEVQDAKCILKLRKSLLK